MWEQEEGVTTRVPCSVAESRDERDAALWGLTSRGSQRHVSLRTRWKPPHTKMRHDKHLHFLCWVPELHLPSLPRSQDSTKCVSNVPYLKQHKPILLFWLVHTVFSSVPQAMADIRVHRLPPGTHRHQHLQDTAILIEESPSQFLRFQSA